MKFYGPSEIFIQTKNINDFLIQEQPVTVDNQLTNNMNENIINGVFDFINN
jgi:hypothetical protein